MSLEFKSLVMKVEKGELEESRFQELVESARKEYQTAMAEGPGQTVVTLSLAHIIDGITRDLRAKGAPANRWATFVHIGA